MISGYLEQQLLLGPRGAEKIYFDECGASGGLFHLQLTHILHQFPIYRLQ